MEKELNKSNDDMINGTDMINITKELNSVEEPVITRPSNNINNRNMNLAGFGIGMGMNSNLNITENEDIDFLASARTKNTAKTNFSNPIEGNNSSLNKENENEDKKFMENYLENSFDRLERIKLDEIDDLFSPVMDTTQDKNHLNMTSGGANVTTNSNNFYKKQASNKNLTTTMFKLNENVIFII